MVTTSLISGFWSETEDGGYEKAILMEFNVDGPILDLI